MFIAFIAAVLIIAIAGQVIDIADFDI